LQWIPGLKVIPLVVVGYHQMEDEN
jgi:hypothetical protein